MSSAAMLRASFLAVACVALPASATDQFEIQVYDDDVGAPGQFGLELHTNYTVAGRSTGDYAGAVPSNHAARLTFEPALGVTEWLELGAYLQFVQQPDFGGRFAGAKVRAKFVVPQRLGLPVHLGLNVEVGRVPAEIEQAGWANEFRPIVAWTNGWWSVAFNPLFGYALTGPEAFKLDLEPCGKVTWNTQRGFAVGAEYYSGLGLLSEGLLPLGQQEHLAFAVFELAQPRGDTSGGSGWELNVAVGHGLTAGTEQQWIVKSIVGKAF